MEISSTQICEDVVALVRHMKSKMGEMAEKHNLTHMQLYALYSILHGDVTMGHVAGTLHCDASNITGIIDRLVVQGLVTRLESTEDRRAKMLSLTDKGQKLMDDITGELPHALGCAKISSSERRILHDTISRLVAE